MKLLIVILATLSLGLSACSRLSESTFFDEFEAEAKPDALKDRLHKALGSSLAEAEAKKVFWTYKQPSDGPLALDDFGGGYAGRTIGSYAKGCLAGAQSLPPDGARWQAMRPHRERNWGHPRLVSYIKTLSEAAFLTGWSGLLVGDMSQARGGPMKSGHASHQIGLDVDIWLNPMPERRLSEEERENLSARSVVLNDGKTINRSVWTANHYKLLKTAATVSDQVSRIFVNPVIKRELCLTAPATDRDWLRKIRPWAGHVYHFHVRLDCDPDDPLCKPQPPVALGDGCDADLERWFRKKTPKQPAKTLRRVKPKPKPIVRVADLPAACMALLQADEGAR